MTTARLSQRVALWVFVSVVVIEAVILIPSLHNRRQELLAHIREKVGLQAALVMTPDGDGQALGNAGANTKRLEIVSQIKGAALYGPDGSLKERWGEAPLGLSSFEGRPNAILTAGDPSRADVLFSGKPWLRDHRLVLRCDTSAVFPQLWGYGLRIAGLVVIISVFVTIGTLTALQRLVINPVLSLRADLIRAGENVGRRDMVPVFHTAGLRRRDELGEVARAFHHMYRQIVEAINQRQAAQASLQQSLEQVNVFSLALNKELEKGRQIQANFLPQKLPAVQGWDIAAYFRPARQVAGDFYDAFALPDGKLGLVVADVCDKGVGAALFMALIRSLIRIFSGQTTEGSGKVAIPVITQPECDLTDDGRWSASCKTLEAVRLTNAYILSNHGQLGMFATLFFGVLDTQAGTLDYVNAGHDPPLIIGDHGIKAKLMPCGPAIGLAEDAVFTVQSALLTPGDVFFSYTDGLTEARSAQDELFGRRRLEDALTNRCFTSAGSLLTHIQANLAAFTQNASPEDDITLLAVRRLGPADTSPLTVL
jgi:serine phosphatase RsbU (regulator of sigma subunit)